MKKHPALPDHDHELEATLARVLGEALVHEAPAVSFEQVWSQAKLRPSKLPPIRRMAWMAVAVCLIVFPTLGYAFSQQASIANLFAELQAKLDRNQAYADEVVASVGRDTILVKDFVFYKGNSELIWQLNHVSVKKSDMQFLKELIENKLLVRYAEGQGYTVSADEVQTYIADLRSHLKKAESTETTETIKELMRDRIRLTGLTEEQFWQSPDIVEMYRNILLVNKFYREESLTDDQLNKIKENLWTDNKNQITIDRRVLYTIKE